MSRGGPPQENAALIFADPWPGMGTQLSRGRDTVDAVCSPGPRCTSINVSLRCAPYFHSCAVASRPVVGLRERLSTPTSRKVVPLAPAPLGGREPSGNAWGILLTWSP